MRIQHNIMAMNAYRNYTNNVSAMKKNLEKLSSGYKINRAGDDAAGLAISEKMRAQITGLETAQKNAKDGISLIQTAEGALTEVHDMLNRMVELATMSANGTYDNTTDRTQLQKEMNQLRTEIDRISKSANFNGIKLLDGSLGEGDDLSVDGVKTIDAAMVEGIDVQKAGPGGSKGEYSFTIDKTFGNGDKFAISFGTGDPTNNEVPAGLTDNNTAGATGTLTFSYDITEQATNSFGGLTTDDQAASIAKTLSQNADIAANFEVTVNGSTITLKNLNEGNKELTVTNVAASNAAGDIKKAALDGTATNTTALAGTASEIEFEDVFAPNTGFELENGGKVELSFTDVNGNSWKATVNIETDPADPTDKGTHAKLLNALKGTGDDAVYFENIDGTVADESRIAVSDLFTVTLENGTTDNGGKYNLKFAGKAGSEIFAGGAMSLTVYDSDGKQVGNPATMTEATGDATDGTSAVFKGLKLDTTNGDADYSMGDKINLTGTLSDGRTFKLTLEAGKDFEIGDTHSDTNDNIIYALAGARGNGVEVQIMDDTDPTVVAETVNSKDIFNEAGGDTKEIQIANNTGNIEFTSNVKSTANNGTITGATIAAADNGAIGATKFTNGIQQTGAATTITVEDGKVAEGSVVKVGDKTYVLTEQDAPADAPAGNIYVKVTDLADGAGVAKALGDAITANAGNDPAYDVSVNGNTVTLTTKEVGSTATPVDAEALGGGSQTALQFTLDPKTVTNGSRVTIEGKEYEFVAKASRATKDEDGNDKYNVIVVDNLNVKEGEGAVTSKQLGDALKAAVEKNVATETNPEGDKISIDVDEKGLVTLKGTDFQQGEDGRFVYNTPKDVEFYSKGGLKLQIADTAEAFNQLNVSIKAVNCKAMGIDEISIGDQDSAGEAIDLIKAAVNYVSDVRGTLGATQNRLDHTINNLSVMTENIQDAESTIRDVDVAEEMMAYTKNNILIQSAQAMLAQANQVPQGVLQLLQ